MLSKHKDWPSLLFKHLDMYDEEVKEIKNCLILVVTIIKLYSLEKGPYLTHVPND
jgi:hypothetical protein